MLRIVEHVTVYIGVAAIMWWELYGPGKAGHMSVTAIALIAGLIAVLLVREMGWRVAAARELREEASRHEAVVEAERLRRRAYDLCASLRLGFEICEGCWAWHPDRAVRELDRLRAAVGQFVAVDLGAPAGN